MLKNIQILNAANRSGYYEARADVLVQQVNINEINENTVLLIISTYELAASQADLIQWNDKSKELTDKVEYWQQVLTRHQQKRGPQI